MNKTNIHIVFSEAESDREAIVDNFTIVQKKFRMKRSKFATGNKMWPLNE